MARIRSTQSLMKSFRNANSPKNSADWTMTPIHSTNKTVLTVSVIAPECQIRTSSKFLDICDMGSSPGERMYHIPNVSAEIESRACVTAMPTRRTYMLRVREDADDPPLPRENWTPCTRKCHQAAATNLACGRAERTINANLPAYPTAPIARNIGGTQTTKIDGRDG